MTDEEYNGIIQRKDQLTALSLEVHVQLRNAVLAIATLTTKVTTAENQRMAALEKLAAAEAELAALKERKRKKKAETPPAT